MRPATIDTNLQPAVKNNVRRFQSGPYPRFRHRNCKPIFDPFFPTKPGCIGMGSRTLVEANDGKRWLDIHLASGRLLDFTLPSDL